MLLGWASLSIIALQGQTPARVAEFVADCRMQASPSSIDGPDPAVRKALIVLTTEVEDGLRKSPNAKDKTIDSWLAPFHSAIEKACPRNDASFGVNVCNIAGRRFVVADMGCMVRTIAVDPRGRKLTLPPEFDFTSWRPFPKGLPNDYVLMHEDLTYAQGYRVSERLIWLKFKGAQAIKVGSIEATTTLDDEGGRVHGGLVTAKTTDEPLALEMLAADFERVRTWDCSHGGLRLVKSVPEQVPLRAVDAAIFNAWHAKHPTRLQSRIRRLVPQNDIAEFDTWSQSRGPGDSVTIKFYKSASFKLVKSKFGLRVVSVANQR